MGRSGQTAATGPTLRRAGAALCATSILATLILATLLLVPGIFAPGARAQQVQPPAAPSVAAASPPAPDSAPASNSAPAPATADPRVTLRGLQDSIDVSAERRKAIQAEIDTVRDDQAKLRAALIATAARVSADETTVADAQKRLDAASGSEEAVKRSLAGRRAVIAEVLAALQRMGRKPPPALLVDPEDVLKAIRTSMLLGAVLPGMRAEVDALAADLGELARARKAIELERAALAEDLRQIQAERARLAALIEARQAALGQAEDTLGGERTRAQALAAQATSLKDLIARMEALSKPAADAAAAARQADERQAAGALAPDAAVGPGTPARDPARLAPAVAFASLKGALPLPVSGTPLRGFGSPDGFGGTERGLRLATGAGAVVASPSDGWVAYAGAYRSFGQLLIINAGSGYYIVLAGMDRINVDLGQFVLAGEPVASMGDGSTRTAAAMALGAAQPILYVEFRKDGATIDPGPWWAKPELQKVRG